MSEAIEKEKEILLVNNKTKNLPATDDASVDRTEEKEVENAIKVTFKESEKKIVNLATEENELTAPCEKMVIDGSSPPPESLEESSKETSNVFIGAETNNSLETQLSEIVEKGSDTATAPTEPKILEVLKQQSPLANVNTSLTTENLLSVLEDGTEKEMANQSTEEVASCSQPQPTRKTAKKYVYRLKSKSGKVLKYTSRVPITLKKPFINLTKMEVEKSDSDDANSDNSTKENHVKENATSTREGRIQIARKKGRAPLSQKPPVITLDDQHSSDTADSRENLKNDSTPLFGMQTRKRKLKFLPDGRIVGSSKKYKSSSAEEDSEDTALSEPAPNESSDEDWEASDFEMKKSTISEARKFTPSERKTIEKKGKIQKMFDSENIKRIKSSVSSPSGQSQLEKSPSTPNRIEIHNNMPLQNNVARKNNSLLGSKMPASSTPSSVKSGVDPAQLLSSLIGITVLPSQLNVVRFKPKVINNRQTAMQKKVALAGDTLRKPASPKELFKNTIYKLPASRPSMQKIFPQPISSLNKTNAIKKPWETKVAPSSVTLSPQLPKRNLTTSTPTNFGSGDSFKEMPNFDDFTDSRTVKTREGPKKLLQQRQKQALDESEEESGKTVYDLVQNVFGQMPAWNLHLMPDTNTFCVAQVSRGRMGIPILKKSIELNSDFFAKIYVHQLHCKKFDGIYDTESKILSLIREIDALAA